VFLSNLRVPGQEGACLPPVLAHLIKEYFEVGDFKPFKQFRKQVLVACPCSAATRSFMSPTSSS